jgi:hypothetical protein
VAPSIGVITNFKSRRNRTSAARISALQDSLGDEVLFRATRSLQEIRAVVEEFIDAG